MEQKIIKGVFPAVRELAVGAGMGLLVGLLIGLAVSEVIGGVIAGLTALLAAFLGLEGKFKKDSTDASSTTHHDARAWRLAAFGIVCALGVLFGMAIRTFNLIGPSLQEQASQWQAIGFTPTQAQSLVAYQVLGIVPQEWHTVNEQRVTGRTASALFANAGQEQCGTLNPERYSDVSELYNAFHLAGGHWQKITEQIDALNNEQRQVLLSAVWQLSCET